MQVQPQSARMEQRECDTAPDSRKWNEFLQNKGMVAIDKVSGEFQAPLAGVKSRRPKAIPKSRATKDQKPLFRPCQQRTIQDASVLSPNTHRFRPTRER